MERVAPAPSSHHGTRSFLSLFILYTNQELCLERKTSAGQVKRSGGQTGKNCECCGVAEAVFWPLTFELGGGGREQCPWWLQLMTCGAGLGETGFWCHLPRSSWVILGKSGISGN